MQTPFSPLSFGKSFMKIRSAIPENGCLVLLCRTEKNEKSKQNKKTSVKHIRITHPPHRRLRKLAMTCCTRPIVCYCKILTNIIRFELLDGVGEVVVTSGDCNLVGSVTGAVFHLPVSTAKHQHPRAVFLHAQNSTAKDQQCCAVSCMHYQHPCTVFLYA